jgi:DNA-binding transcriptional ArsR family regulator
VTTEQTPRTIELTPQSLKALVHPLRVAMLGQLRTDGPATSSDLARRLDTSSGATSYHLRQLERHGFVAEVPEIGTARERYWEARHDYTSVERSHMREDAEALALFDAFTRLASNLREVEFVDWIEHQDQWGHGWTDAAAVDDYLLQLNQGELAELVESIRSLIRRRAARPVELAPDDSEAVRVHLLAFPVAEPGAAVLDVVRSDDA